MNINPVTQQRINLAVGQLDRWLDSMRGPQGYTGPQAHWWQQRLVTTNTAFDWRYEGIIAGYIHLWRRTGDGGWLAKAQWAGDDLLAGQTPQGQFGNRDATGDEPHASTATCASALLDLALALHQAQSAVWQPYAAAGELTIHGILIDALWDEANTIFRDTPGTAVFHPHRNASICEALFRHGEIRQMTGLVERYALPTLRVIMRHQVYAPNDPMDGAIPYQLSTSHHPAKFLPLSIARCIPCFLQAYEWTDDKTFFDAAWRAFAFIHRHRSIDGSFPAIIYNRHHVNQYPQWIAGTGDVLRAAYALGIHGLSINVEPTLQWLLAGQDGSGGIRTAHGLGSRVLQRTPRMPDVRDLLHVVGWNDKAFRALALHATNVQSSVAPLITQQICGFRGRFLTFREDHTSVEIVHNREVRYRWRKGDEWPAICTPEFVLA
jgi:hypothetical protein